MSDKQQAASDVIGPAILALLGLPETTEKLTITLEGSKPIKVECSAYVYDQGKADNLVRIIRDYNVTEKG